MKKIVLWENHKKLKFAKDEIICITFLTTHHSVWSMIPLIIRTYLNIKKQFSSTQLYSLSFLIDRERVHFFDLRLSLLAGLQLIELKKNCMRLELNKLGVRIADIDVHIFNRKFQQLSKVSRKTILY